MRVVRAHRRLNQRPLFRLIIRTGLWLGIGLSTALSTGCVLLPSVSTAEILKESGKADGGGGADTDFHLMTEYVPDTGWYDPQFEPQLEHREIANAPNHRTARTKPPEHDFLTKPLAHGVLMSEYGFRVNPTGKHEPRKHKGVDYAAPTGTEVYAAGDGVIVHRYRSKSYGNYLRIKHANGFSSVYAHLHSYAPGMLKGTQVKRGQVIGQVGSTGRSTGPHLHFELIHNSKAIDPLYTERNNKPRVKDNQAELQTSNLEDSDSG